MTVTAYKPKIPERAIDVIESGETPNKRNIVFNLDRDLEFNTQALQSYMFAAWESVIYDAMVMAAAIEFADLAIKRPTRGWTRRISLRIPVHDPDRWNSPAVLGSLRDAVEFLTGDFWAFEFIKRSTAVLAPQESLPFPRPTEAVIAYSNGLDSRAVAGLVSNVLGDKLVRVHIGRKAAWAPVVEGRPQPFIRVPYKFKIKLKNRETSARSRGFKFALISGLAAYLAGAKEILIPESGQGAFGPALVLSATHAHPDYRNHPLFTARMARFFEALLGKPVRFAFPRLWHTKGQTLKEFAALPERDSWQDTRSCWRDSRWSSVNHGHLQCGVCAACMLRRMSVHAAGLAEESGTYICTDLNEDTLDKATHPDFTRRTAAFEQYAIAGTLHLDHMADMIGVECRPVIRRHAALTASALGIPKEEAEAQLVAMLERHAAEWRNFVNDLGERSFVRKWTRISQ
nr:7-cyano-7-deazaguanine synthase [Mesorhizobium sp. WSM4875]